jgi:ribosome-associated translation inhibitor RaiA
MRNALSITFKNTPHTDHLIQYIENKFRRLKKIHGDIIQCTVTVSSPRQPHRSRKPRSVTITTRVPGKTLSARRSAIPEDGRDLYATLGETFDAIEIQAASRSAAKVSYRNFRKLSRADIFPVAV